MTFSGAFILLCIYAFETQTFEIMTLNHFYQSFSYIERLQEDQDHPNSLSYQKYYYALSLFSRVIDITDHWFLPENIRLENLFMNDIYQYMN